MGILWKVLPVILFLAWYYRDPIPRDFSEPWKLRVFLASMRTILDTSWLLEQFGLASVVKAVNGAQAIMHHQDPDFDRSRISDVTFDGVGVRVYRPNSATTPDQSGFPALVFYHGGGWAVSDVEIYDDFVIPIAKQTDIVIISVEYRRSPEHPFPIPFEDCLTATKYFMKNADKYGVDPDRVSIGGDSAGGNLAAAIALKLRDDQFSPQPKLQVLVYPVLQALDFNLPSMVQNSDGPLITNYWMRHFTSMYATGSPKYTTAMYNNQHTTPAVKQAMHNSHICHDNIDMKYHYNPYKKPQLDYGNEAVWNEVKDIFMNPYFSPLLAEDVSGLPETYMYTAHYDILRDEGILYAKRLQEAGVPTTHIAANGAYHGACSHSHMFPEEGGQCILHIVNFLNEKL